MVDSLAAQPPQLQVFQRRWSLAPSAAQQIGKRLVSEGTESGTLPLSFRDSVPVVAVVSAPVPGTGTGFL